ncbi:MAG TPA: inositol monophosphatase family protein [Thermoleophilaceae bacterium]|nr:inositol monophosphatase family protein [Thermoleophilaceae bacterium]
MRELVRELALALRECVLPLLGAHAQRAHTGAAAGGDVTFAIDSAAEELLDAFLAERAPDVAFYSEDRGLVAPPGARSVLVVDPIDGTRPALAGLESCCVSIAAAPLGDAEPRFRDITHGCVVEIKTGRVFMSGELEPRLSANDRVDRMFWAFGFRGRPARELTEVLADLIDASSVGGSVFDLGSSAFNMTRLITGQLDAVVEPSTLIYQELPELRAEFERVGGGALLTNPPYDLAGSWTLLRECGAVVTDARGRALDDLPLLGSGAEHQTSFVAAANPVLHGEIIARVGHGIERLRATRQ